MTELDVSDTAAPGNPIISPSRSNRSHCFPSYISFVITMSAQDEFSRKEREGFEGNVEEGRSRWAKLGRVLSEA